MERVPVFIALVVINLFTGFKAIITFFSYILFYLLCNSITKRERGVLIYQHHTKPAYFGILLSRFGSLMKCLK